MALTPEDVVNKRFQPTKFREGYDQDEVDDFLDEVVVELRRLNQENDELKQRLVAADSRVAELQRSGASAAPAPVPAPVPVVAPVPAAVSTPTTAMPVAAPSPVDETQSTNNLLQLARRLHEEHVAEGKAKRDELIADGHATAARLVAEAESKQKEQIAVLDQQRVTLENKIDELRTFERDYRAKLKSYIEGQLRDLDQAGGSAPTNTGSAPVAQNTGSAPSYQGFGA
ncbi:DivIVA domain-containing protein [Gryllotalpicola protaetiae]|uniref:Cell wall synthesis protein Wag31 n=1 Tax=Gryllotalpicola protaetiae TaxID=2419771 RepID=A0A387C2L0_9MICO|nr:DivIVA domain-containing protein [Gryllotalpicola protaetiae]AYG04761.1 DivIVA domain-containing protein [Gryllotalpicola protaetiae]